MFAEIKNQNTMQTKNENMNWTTVKGNLGQSPEVKEVKGKDDKIHRVAVFSIAENSDSEKTNWIPCRVWNENFGKTEVEKLGKGDFVELTGYNGKEFLTKNGETKRDLIVTEIKLLKSHSGIK